MSTILYAYTLIFNALLGNSQARWQALLSFAPVFLAVVLYLILVILPEPMVEYPQFTIPSSEDQLKTRISMCKKALVASFRKISGLQDKLSFSRQTAAHASAYAEAEAAKVKSLTFALTKSSLRADHLELNFLSLFRALGVRSVDEIIDTVSYQASAIEELVTENNILMTFLQGFEVERVDQNARSQRALAGHFRLFVEVCSHSTVL